MNTKDKKCTNCVEEQNCRDSFASWIFFAIGLIATVAIRVVTVLIHVAPVYGKIAWYIGVGGFLIFFIYKFKINQTRARVIKQRELVGKILQQKALSKEDSDLVGAILCGISSRKERLNYLFIFVLSAIALILAIYFDFIK